MTTSVQALLALLDLDEVGPDLFLGASPATSMQRLFGGAGGRSVRACGGAHTPVDEGVVMASMDHAMWLHRPFRVDE